MCLHAQVAAAQADVRAQEAEMRAAAVQQQSSYFEVGFTCCRAIALLHLDFASLTALEKMKDVLCLLEFEQPVRHLSVVTVRP